MLCSLNACLLLLSNINTLFFLHLSCHLHYLGGDTCPLTVTIHKFYIHIATPLYLICYKLHFHLQKVLLATVICICVLCFNFTQYLIIIYLLCAGFIHASILSEERCWKKSGEKRKTWVARVKKWSREENSGCDSGFVVLEMSWVELRKA